MHLSEGVVSLPILQAGGALTVAGTIVGLKKIDEDHLMTTAMLSATFFVASLIHVPLGPGSVHLLLNGLMALILGWACVPAILVALILQAVFFQYGGLTVLGVNVVIIAGGGLLGSCCFRSMLRNPRQRNLAAFGAGFLSVGCASLLLCATLVTTHQDFIGTARVIFAAQLPVMVVEGVMTLFIVSFLAKVQPEILGLTHD
ncbi:MAG: cobalt transporter CbiM [Spirochaetales bacterium]|jgi:cobalt/nickel transport system permease protein|nr:cobalt transporter CbiM [Spirochaetales bacterium]